MRIDLPAATLQWITGEDCRGILRWESSHCTQTAFHQDSPMLKRFACGAPCPHEQPRAGQLSWREGTTGATMKLDTRGKLLCWSCGAAELGTDSGPSEEREELRPLMKRSFPSTFSGFPLPPKHATFLPNLRNNFPNENASSIVTT